MKRGQDHLGSCGHCGPLESFEQRNDMMWNGLHQGHLASVRLDRKRAKPRESRAIRGLGQNPEER